MLKEPVECMDGTLDYGGIEAPCIGRGGEKVQKNQANLFSNKNLLILAVIVGGYFAYKKFKK